jgi:putative phosphoesterase
MKLGVFSDIHGVIGAFEQTRELLLSEGAERFLYLGDIIGYVPHLGALKSLMAAQIPALRGNHEAMLLSDQVNIPNDDIYQLGYVRENITAEERAFLQSLPCQRQETIDGFRCLFVHGSPSDPVYGYVYPDTDLAQFDSAMGDHDIVFMGNTHRPFVKECNGKMYVNVGSCGLPRGGAQFGSACLFDTSSGQANLIQVNLAHAASASLDQTKPADAIVKVLKILQG